MILSLVTIAALAWGLMSRNLFHNQKETGFFGKDSWKRKYKTSHLGIYAAPDNRYYKFFKIPYKEKFPLSATLLVWTTDGFHLLQMIATKSLTLAVALQSENWILNFVILTILWHSAFYVTYTKTSVKEVVAGVILLTIGVLIFKLFV